MRYTLTVINTEESKTMHSLCERPVRSLQGWMKLWIAGELLTAPGSWAGPPDPEQPLALVGAVRVWGAQKQLGSVTQQAQ